MHLENFLAIVELGKVNINLTVETSGTQQRFIENINTVSSRKYNNTTVSTKTIHLGEQLVEGAFALIVPTHVRVLASGTSHGVYLVDKHDARSFILSLLEKVAHTRCAYTHKHLHKVATRQREEWHIGLTGNSLCQQSLTSSRRSHKQSSLRDFSTQVGVALRVLEEVNNLSDLGFSLGKTSNVFERHLGIIILVEQFSFRLTNAEYTSTACPASHATRHPEPEQDEQQDGSEAPYPATDIAGGGITHITLEGSALIPLLYIILKFLARGDLSADVRLGVLGFFHVLKQNIG